MSDEERSDSLQSVEIPNEMYQQAIFNNNGTLTQMSTSAVSDLHQLEVLTGMSQQTLNDLSAPYLRILEQPKQRGFRFRYDCEGPSHGGLPGQNNQKSKRTYPSVEIVNYTGLARIVVTLVTNEEVPRPHAHSIVGKHCKDGACTVQVGPSDMTASFPNLGILHVTRKKVESVLKGRLRDQQKLYRTVLDNKGCSQYVTESDEQLTKKAQEMSKAMDLSVVKLCFQAYLPDTTGHFIRPLAPVISVPIFDSKAPGATTLKICRMDKSSGCVTGNEEVYLLCDKVQKEDVQVRFFEMKTNGEITWEDYGEFGPTDVHRQFAIVFKTPRYKDCKIEKPVYVQVQLQRRSDREVSDPKPFIYHPQVPDIESILRKRKKGISDTFFDGSSGGKGSFGGSGGGGSGYPFTEERPRSFNFGTGSGGGGPSNSLHEPAMNVNRDQQHLVIMKQYQEQQQQRQQQQKQKQQNRQNMILQSRGIGKENKQVVISSGCVQSVQDSQPAILPRMDVNQDDDSDLEVDSYPIGKNKNEKDTAWVHTEIEPRETLQATVKSVEKVDNVTDTSMQTDAISLDYDSMAWSIAERTSRALHDFAITADIKMILAVQRHLLAVEDENGDTPLHLAVIHRQYDVVVSLVNVIISIPNQNIINQVNKLHQTPLHLAVITQQSDIVELLMLRGADPNIMDHSGNMPLHLAANNGFDKCTLHLVQRPVQSLDKSRMTIQPIRADLNATNLDGFTAAHISVNRCDLKNLKLLVKNGANVNIPDGKSGRTPLHYAVERENFALLSYLIADADCDIHLQTFAGDTALHLACSLDYVAVAAVLITAGADPYIENYDASDESIEGDHTLDEPGKECKQEIPEEEVGKEVCGKTPMDLAETERMIHILKGDRYIPRHLQMLDTTYASGQESKSQKSGIYPTTITFDTGYQSTTSTSRSSVFLGDLNRLDSLVRQKLESLLDEVNPHKDWISLADRLGLGTMINQLKQFDSPTSILLDQYEAMDGTIAELKTVLKSLNREDVLNVFEELNMASTKGTRCEGTNHLSQVDSGLVSSLQSMHVQEASMSAHIDKSIQCQ